jgi:phenylacetate-CoA ligase
MRFKVYKKIVNTYENEGLAVAFKKIKRFLVHNIWVRKYFWNMKYFLSSTVHSLSKLSVVVDFNSRDEVTEWARINIYDGNYSAEDSLSLKIANNNNHLFPCARLKGEIIGFVKVGFNKVYIKNFKKSFTFDQRIAFVYEMYIDPKYRNHGVNSCLQSEIMIHLKNEGFQIVANHVRSNNAAALHVVNKCGFQKIGTSWQFRFFGLNIFNSAPHQLTNFKKSEDLYSIICKNAVRFYETVLRQRKTFSYLKDLKQSQWISRDKTKVIQLNRLQSLLKHAYQNVPYYKQKFDELKMLPEDIKDFNDFSRFPILTKEDIRRNHDKLTAVNYSKNDILRTATGGSSGIPLQLKLDHDNYERRWAAVRRVYEWADYILDGDKAVYIWGGSVGKINYFKEFKHHADDWLRRHKTYNTFHFNKNVMDGCIKEINHFKPKIIIGYTTPVYNFARHISESSKTIWSPRSVIIAAEKLYSHQRALIEKVFLCPVYETYGCREVTSIAGECEKRKGMHINMENIYLEVLKDNMPANSDEVGEIVLTDLTNYCMPLIRYKNEDLGAISDRTCDCGRGLQLLEKVDGRILDMIQTSDGKLVAGEFFPHLFKDFEEIEKFQIIQNDLHSLTIKIVKNNSYPTKSMELLKKEVIRVLGTGVNVDFQFVNDISLTKSGKHRVVMSKIPITITNS